MINKLSSGLATPTHINATPTSKTLEITASPKAMLGFIDSLLLHHRTHKLEEMPLLHHRCTKLYGGEARKFARNLQSAPTILTTIVDVNV